MQQILVRGYQQEYRFLDAQMCFERAIMCGRLSRDQFNENYAGHYMYMGTVNGRDLFKSRVTRQYVD